MDIQARYLVVGGILAASFLIALVYTRSLERSLFAAYVLSLPIRAAIRLGPTPPDIAGLLYAETASGNAAWIGYPFNLLHLYAFDIPLFLLIGMSMMASAFKGRPLRARLKIGIPLLLLAAALLSLIHAPQKSLAYASIIEFVKALLGFWYVVYRTRNIRNYTYSVTLLYIAVFIQSVLAVTQFGARSSLGISFSGVEWVPKLVDTEYIRSSGTFAHPQMMAMYIAMFLPLLFSLAFIRNFRISWIHRFIVVVLGLLSMILTFSRMGWLATLVAFLLIPLALMHSMKRVFKLVLQAVVLLALLMALLLLFADLIVPNITFERTGSELAVASDLYGVAFAMIRTHPLLGVGLNNFSYTMPEYDRSGVSSYYPAPVHNLFILAYAETGFLGFLGTMAMFLVPARTLWKLKKGSNLYISRAAVGLLGGLLGLFLLSLTSWTYYTVQSQVWFFFGMVYGLWHIAREDARYYANQPGNPPSLQVKQ